ncbi:hypothetical protein CPC08DRAFT_429518 [Agrocybe pediades]|nr:hypothetical protein CPC08DRAFT_429518 [Agrocybe pediades]
MDRLRIIDCAYSCSKPVSPSITVKELFLSNFAPTVKLFSNKRLHVLSLYGFSVPLLSHFMTEGINNHLTDIFIALGARDSMITVTAFLGSCPALERLRLSSRLPLSDPPQLCLPANALPRLSSYSGPAYFATSIIPGRPVQDIETTDHRGMNLQQNDIEMQHFLGSLHRSTGHIRKLHICHIPLSATTLALIFQFFPRLRSLEVGFDRSTARKDQFPITAHDRDELALVREYGCGPASACSWQDTGGGDDGSLKDILRNICNSHSQLPKTIAHFRISFHCASGKQLITFSRECTVVLTLSRLYSELKSIAFGNGVTNYRHWVRCDNGLWKPGSGSEERR